MFLNLFLNGPLTASIVFIGSILNILTIYVLSTHTLARRDSASIRIKESVKIKSRKSSQNSTKINDITSTTSGMLKRQNSRKKANRPRIYTHLLWLSLFDTACLISALFMYSLPNLFPGSFPTKPIFFPVYYMLSNTALTASVWLMCALMFERYKTLCSPLTKALHARSWSSKRIHLILSIVSLVAIFYSLPRFFELGVHRNSNGEYTLMQTSLVQNQLYMIGYRIIGGMVFYSLVPYILLFLISWRVAYVLSSAARTRIVMNAKVTKTGISDSEKILIAVMVKFLASRFMPTALDVAEHIVSPQTFLMSSTATLFVDISNLVVVASSATNFFIFFMFSISFRRTINSLFCCCLGQSAKMIQRWSIRNKKSIEISEFLGKMDEFRDATVIEASPMVSTIARSPDHECYSIDSPPRHKESMGKVMFKL